MALTERTTTHIYPQEETAAMRRFYGGKRCVVTLWDDGHWAHMLDAALPSSNPQLQWMLQRNLRQDRYPAHAAEVHENVVPLAPTEHSCIDLHPARATLFLHEDVVAKTLEFERELKEWRFSEVQAGRGDPGRPSYDYVFLVQGASPPTPHRWHASILYPLTVRHGTNPALFQQEQCPGIDPPHANPFPVFDTMLSIPFSLMFNLPRLSGLITSSPFRRELVTMVMEVVSLWAWDPVIPQNTPNTVGNTQNVMPRPIYDASRNATFAAMRRPPPSSTAPILAGLSAASGSRCVVQADSGAYFIGASPQVRLQDGALTTFLPDHNTNMEKELICHSPTHFAATCSLDHSISLSGTMLDLECGSNSNDELEPKLDVPSLRAHVAVWLEGLDKESLDPLPADTVDETDSFIPGCVGGMTANDVLMMKGHINPSVYVHFYDLSLYT